MKELAPGLRIETLQRIPRSRKELYKITGRMVEGDEILNVEMEIFKDGELKHMVRDDIDDDELYNDRRHEHD